MHPQANETYQGKAQPTAPTQPRPVFTIPQFAERNRAFTVSVLDHYIPGYVYWALKSPRVRREVLRFATGWKGEDLREITLTELRSLSMPTVDKAMQMQIAESAETLAQATVTLSGRAESARTLMKVFSEQVLEGESRVHGS